jgi:DNA-binding NarL/FixJ family response regulator
MRILVVDDHDIVRVGLKQVLLARPGWEICAEAKTGKESIALAKQFEPAVVVMDIAMPEMNGLEAARQIRQLLPKTKVIILTLHFSYQLMREIVEAGISGYILKSDADRELVTAVQTVASGGFYFTAQAADTLQGDHAKPGARTFRKPLTRRELEVTTLLAEGNSAKQVAAKLGMSIKTAETHRANVLRKLELHSVAELARYAIKNSIIPA